MNRRTTLALTTIGLLCSGAAISVGTGTSQAQQSDTDKIKETINGFLEALEALDIHKMEDFWAHDARSTFIGPRDKTITTGWDAVRKKLEGIIAFWSELKHTTQEGPHIYQNGGTAWVLSIVLNLGKPKSGAPSNPTPAFNAFILEKRSDRWLIVSASAWRVPQ
jgi:ketosteroid isomerase-like protein